jgi:actin-like ATPase involved in cell morphogenesis
VSSWTLGIDFGTTFTVAAVANGSHTTLVDVEADGSCRMPSAVLLNEGGGFAVGRSAIHQALFHPDRFEPTPKRVIGEGDVMLGDDFVPVVDVVSAVLDRVAREARNVAGGDAPGRVVLTHPADWGAARTDVLRQAAAAAGYDRVELVAEPVAAAVHIGAGRLGAGQYVAVYDFGGGTLDVAVLRRTSDGFEVAGPPGGRDPLGGEYIDSRIIEHLGSGPLGQHADWPKLLDPPDVQWRRHAANWRSEVRKAKEGLSNQTVWQLWVPGLEREVQLGRAELEDLIRADVTMTVDVLVTTVRGAGIEPSDLAGVFLVGGSSRIPAVAAEVWNRTGLKPSVQSDPKTVVALGATAWWPARKSEPGPELRRTFSSRLAMATRTVFWTSPVYCYGYVTVTTEDGGTVTVSDEPVTGNLEHIAETAEQRWAGQPGYQELAIEHVEWLGAPALERQFVLHEPSAGQWTERYAVIGDRAFAGLAPAQLAGRLDNVRRHRSTLDPNRFYQLGVTCQLSESDRAHERIELIRAKSGHRVTTESYDLDAEWSEQRLSGYRSHPAYTVLGTSTTRLLGAVQKTWGLGLAGGVPGQMNTFWIAGEGGLPQQTRIWVGQAGGRSYLVTATLPEKDKLGFRPLLAHATLTADG